MRYALFLIMMTVWMPPAAAQDVDVVPRDRLVTPGELLSLLDLEAPVLSEVRARADAGNQAEALAELGRYLRTRATPRYFFANDELASRLDRFAQIYPGATERAGEATTIYRERFGADVEWMIPGSDRHGVAHDPNVIRYLAKQENADNFALAHLLSEENHLDFIREHIRDFVADYEAGLTQGEPNDVFERFYAGHRTRNWLAMHHLLRADADYGAEDEVYMLRVFLLHGARLFDQSRRFNWGNHQLHGLAGLYEMTTMYPELPVMQAWNRQARDLLMEHLEREIAEDGFQFERASHYHLLDIINYFRVYRLAQLNSIELPPLFHERFPKMFDAIVALSLPTGGTPIIQDVSADFDVRTDPVDREMALGALLYENPEYRYLARATLPADFFWFFDADAYDRYRQLEAREPSVASTALPASRYYTMRTGWDEDDLYLLIDGGLAEHKPDHTQGGILGVIGYGYGDQFLPNYPVMYRHPSYKTLKNSYAKSVAMVDGRPQGQQWIDNKSRTGFGIWGELPEPSVHEWTSGDRYDIFRGSHDGYDDLGVSYERTIYFFKPHYWIVLDDFKGDRVHAFQQVWQGTYEVPEHQPLPFRHSGSEYYVPDDPPTYRAVQEGPSSRLHIVQADPDRMTVTTRQDYFLDSVVFETSGHTDYTFTTLLFPESADGDVLPRIRHFRRPGAFEEVVATAGDVTGFLYFSDDDELEVERVRSDAGRVALTYERDRLEALLITGGSEVATADFELEVDAPVDLEASRTSTGWSLRLLTPEPATVVFTACEQTSSHRLTTGAPVVVQGAACAVTSR